jgi:glycosyltransferase involved in cell wall biosynthesis
MATEPAVAGRVSGLRRFAAPIYSVQEQVLGSMILLGEGRPGRVVHFPHYNAPWVVPPQSVVTVHDLIHFRVPGDHGWLKAELARTVLTNVVRKARLVIVPSRATAADLVEVLPEAADRIRLIPHGVSPTFAPLPAGETESFKRERGLGQYLLYVGNRKSHKNLGRLLRAYRLLREESPGLQLVIAGKKFEAEDEVDRLRRELKLDGLREWEPAGDEELRRLYCGAAVFVFPSQYEGFGFPPLEAMACGTPVASARATSLPEVVGEAGVYFDPRDVEDLAQTVSRVLSDDELRSSLRQLGLTRSGSFTWERTARATLAVYGEVCREA